jgi:hypothetical protein
MHSPMDLLRGLNDHTCIGKVSKASQISRLETTVVPSGLHSQ